MLRGIALFVLGVLFGLFVTFQGCERTAERVDTPAKTEWVEPSAQQDKPVVASGDIQEHVVVEHVYVPVNKTVTTRDTVYAYRYMLRDSAIYVEAQADSTGMLIDSLSLPNRKSVLFAEDGKGGVTVSVHNTNPYFSTANVIGEYYRPKQLQRVAPGLFVGAALTPKGIQPVVGAGLVLHLGKRRSPPLQDVGNLE